MLLSLCFICTNWTCVKYSRWPLNTQLCSFWGLASRSKNLQYMCAELQNCGCRAKPKRSKGATSKLPRPIDSRLCFFVLKRRKKYLDFFWPTISTYFKCFCLPPPSLNGCPMSSPRCVRPLRRPDSLTVSTITREDEPTTSLLDQHAVEVNCMRLYEHFHASRQREPRCEDGDDVELQEDTGPWLNREATVNFLVNLIICDYLRWTLIFVL